MAIKLEDLDIHVLIERGTVIDKQCNCDSAFMEVMMPEVGRHLREKFHWVDCHDPIYLVMDNAGGHGTSDAINNYTRHLQEFRVEIIWQVPRSPETNMLDLGVWMSIQNLVEKTHKGQRC